jgi:flagellin-like protein
MAVKHMKLKLKYRRKIDERAVSPIIAVILMVSITVILAAVAYVMFVGMIPSAEEAKRVGIYVKSTGDGQNWSVEIITAPSGLHMNDVYITTKGLDGLSIIDHVRMSEFNGTEDINPAGTLNVGDSIILSKSTHPPNCKVQLMTSSIILSEATLL